MLVFYTTDSLEGWPDTVHGDIITAMLTLAAKRHMERFFVQPGWVLDAEKMSIEVNFKAPVHLKDICSILVAPACKSSRAPDRGWGSYYKVHATRLRSSRRSLLIVLLSKE